jgi:hypothetical protein
MLAAVVVVAAAERIVADEEAFAVEELHSPL